MTTHVNKEHLSDRAVMKWLRLGHSPCTDSLCSLAWNIPKQLVVVSQKERKKKKKRPRLRLLVDLQTLENNSGLVLAFFPNPLTSHPWVTMLSYVFLSESLTNKGGGKRYEYLLSWPTLLFGGPVTWLFSVVEEWSGGSPDPVRGQPSAPTARKNYRPREMSWHIWRAPILKLFLQA